MLLLLQSCLVYGLMILVMLHAGKFAYEQQYPDGFLGNDIYANEKLSFLDIITKSHFIIPILVFCLFAALRYNVGVDCGSYRQDFYDMLQKGSTGRDNYEMGYLFLLKITTLFTNKHYLHLGLLSFLQISLLYYAMRKESYLFMFYGLALFFTGTYFSLMNGIRQNIAATAFVAMIPLFLNKKYWIYILPAVIAAMLFHKSAILIILFGFLGYILRNKMLSSNIQLAILFLCLVCMNEFGLDFLRFNNISDYGAQIGYQEGEIEGYVENENMDITFGLRSCILLLNYIIVILYSRKLDEFFNSQKFRCCYNIFFWGICLSHLFYNNFTMKRILFYTTIFNPLIISYLLFYLWFNKNKSNYTVLTIVIATLTTFFGYFLFEAVQLYPFESLLYKFDF
ncbi:MAG: EpsG family protein [Bacteroidaceae bacterium]|nr:EpsG family protein [Bacteroidaceae bacterium]